MAGILYVVSTPIGNLEDITLRALRVLREVSVIACEDTRQTRKLLAHYEIGTPVVSYHEHNEVERAAELLERLRAGESVALVSDAGTPLISDPGYRLVSQAAQQGIRIEPVPGPSAVLAALATSGLPCEKFLFAGFLPAKAGARKKALEELKKIGVTAVLFEAPHRILQTLEALEEVYGDTPVVVAREVTKVHEEFLRGTARELRRELEARGAIRGELTLVVSKPEGGGKGEGEPSAQELAREVAVLVKEGKKRKEAVKEVAQRYNLPARHVYAATTGRTLQPQKE